MLKRMVVAAALVVTNIAAAGESPDCAVRSKNVKGGRALRAMARISEPVALRTAIGTIKHTDVVSVLNSELEVEHGCLVWSFDLSVPGIPGIQEVQVDAGDGKVLSSEREDERQEAAERKKDAVQEH
jgi:uncharacterized membrane protein YkoI